MCQTKYSKKLFNTIRSAKLDSEELIGALLCLYINSVSIDDCAKLFNSTKEKITNILKSEGLYNFKACNKCGHLKNIITGFRQYKDRDIRICVVCEKEYNQKQKKKYNRANKEKKKKYNQKYYQENKKELLKKDKLYYQKNKKEIRKRGQKYYQENKEKILVNYRQYNKKLASLELVQKLAKYEEVFENQIRCKYCGQWLIPTISQIHNRLNGVKINDHSYIYCSEECKRECPTYGQKKYPKDFKPATSREVNPELRQLVLLRDNYTCQKCGKTQKELNTGLHCHHIIPHINSPLETNDPDNCITLCKDCHKLVHKLPDCGYHELKCR